MVEGPADERELLGRGRLVVHPAAADEKGVEVGDDGGDPLFGIGHQKAEGVEGVGAIELVEDHRRAAAIAQRVKVHIEESLQKTKEGA